MNILIWCYVHKMRKNGLLLQQNGNEEENGSIMIMRMRWMLRGVVMK